ncbi:MAG: helix-turn-helix transcriptional regulator [Bacteroidales bacterium]
MSRKPVSNINRKRLLELSTFLRELRLNSNLTQQDLSNYNLHRNTIIRAENNHNITLITLFELADAFDISLSELFLDIE